MRSAVDEIRHTCVPWCPGVVLHVCVWRSYMDRGHPPIGPLALRALPGLKTNRKKIQEAMNKSLI